MIKKLLKYTQIICIVKKNVTINLILEFAPGLYLTLRFKIFDIITCSPSVFFHLQKSIYCHHTSCQKPHANSFILMEVVNIFLKNCSS